MARYTPHETVNLITCIVCGEWLDKRDNYRHSYERTDGTTGKVYECPHCKHLFQVKDKTNHEVSRMWRE